MTSLADSGPGTLRDAVQEKGPRIVVFEVDGTIELRRPLDISEPFLTIAGQTAPGDGIAIKQDGSFKNALVELRAHDVILRYLRLRPGPNRPGITSDNLDALSIESPDAYNVMVDHVSLSWAVDETMDIFAGAHDITVQWSILAEGLHCSTHTKTLDNVGGPCPGGGGRHSRGVTISLPPGSVDPPDNISMHHNLFAHDDRRHPNITSRTFVDFVNNVIYDPGTLGSKLGFKQGSAGGSPGDSIEFNYFKNFVKPGPSTIEDLYMISLAGGQPGTISIFFKGNKILKPIRKDLPEAFDDRGFLLSRRNRNSGITTTGARRAYKKVLVGAGATLPARDSVDARIVAETKGGTGGLVNHPDEVGGWPLLASGTPLPDADSDGMPHDWERQHGLNPSLSGDGAGDLDGDGYTNVEEYLNDTDPNEVDA